MNTHQDARRGIPGTTSADVDERRTSSLGAGLRDLVDDTKPRRAHRATSTVDRLAGSHPQQDLIDEALHEWIARHRDDPRVAVARTLISREEES